MQFIQALTRWPANGLNLGFFISIGTLTHCRLGYFLFLGEGLNLPLNLFSLRAIILPLWQIVHFLDIILLS